MEFLLLVPHCNYPLQPLTHRMNCVIHVNLLNGIVLRDLLHPVWVLILLMYVQCASCHCMFINGSICRPDQFAVTSVSYWRGTTMASPAKLPIATTAPASLGGDLCLAASPERDEKQKDGPIANKVVMAASPNLGEEEEDGAQMSDAAPDMELTPRGLGVVAWHVARQVFVIKM